MNFTHYLLQIYYRTCKKKPTADSAFSSSAASKKKRTVSAIQVQASNTAAKEIFQKQDDNEIQNLKAELAILRKELEEKKNVTSCS